jgi:hypothetical protein
MEQYFPTPIFMIVFYGLSVPEHQQSHDLLKYSRMKIRNFSVSSAIILAFFSLICVSLQCKETDEPENETLTGKWKLSKMSWENQSESGLYSQKQLDSIGVIWEFEFFSDGKITQTTNLSGPLVTFPGTWSVAGNQLTLTLTNPYDNNSTGILNYDFSVSETTLKLNWTISGGTKYVAEFNKYK